LYQDRRVVKSALDMAFHFRVMVSRDLVNFALDTTVPFPILELIAGSSGTPDIPLGAAMLGKAPITKPP
jgi:hypothetical protein